MARTAERTPDGPAMAGHGRPRAWRTQYADAAAFVGRGFLAGLVCGALIGGIGGRLAMFVLRLTSDDAVRGLETDDGFVIGEFTAATAFLVIVCAGGGAVAGLIYLAVREWSPPRARPLVFSLLAGSVGGALIVNPDGFDFTLLGPRWLAVAMFVALPAAYGVALSLLAERLLRPGGWPRGRWRWLAGLPLLLLLATGPFGLAIVLAVVLLVAAAGSEQVVRLWRSPLVTWLGRGAVAVLTCIGGVQLTRDILAML